MNYETASIKEIEHRLKSLLTMVQGFLFATLMLGILGMNLSTVKVNPDQPSTTHIGMLCLIGAFISACACVALFVYWGRERSIASIAIEHQNDLKKQKLESTSES